MDIMKKEILFDEELRKKLLAGAYTLARAVRVTLGPCGRFVGIKNFGAPSITKDGVSVAKEVEPDDPFENMGASLLKEVAARTNDTAGDGTTTSTVLGFEMVKEGYKSVSAGAQPIEIKRGMDKATEIVVDYIKKSAVQINGSQEKVVSVATISTNNDEVLGKLIAEAYQKVGKDGIVNAEESKGVQTYVEYKEGMSFDEGWMSNYFINNKNKASVEFENASVLVTDKKINRIEDIAVFLDESVKNNQPLLMICEELSGEALNVVILNVLQGNLKASAVKCPGYGLSKKDWLEDIAVMTGATVITDATGAELKDCGPEFLGHAESVKSTRTDTIIVGGKGDEANVSKYVKSLKELQKNTESKKDKESIEKRIAKFSSSAATIKVGGETNAEVGERKDRVDDAKAAVKAALEEGIVEGGGLTLVKASEKLAASINDKNFPTEDMKRGARIIANALKEPLKAIADNAGYSGDVVYNKCAETGCGFNAKTGEYGNMFDMGIIDPAKVTVASVVNANSVAGIMLTTNCAICRLDEGKDN